DSDRDRGGEPDVIRYQSKHDSRFPLWQPSQVCKPHANSFVNCLTKPLLVSMSALTRKQTLLAGPGMSALCQIQNSDLTQYTYTIVGVAGAVGIAGARWISRMSPWCTVAT